MTLQKTWIKLLDLYVFVLHSLYECFEMSEFWVNRLSMEEEKSLMFNKKYSLSSQDELLITELLIDTLPSTGVNAIEVVIIAFVLGLIRPIVLNGSELV